MGGRGARSGSPRRTTPAGVPINVVGAGGGQGAAPVGTLQNPVPNGFTGVKDGTDLTQGSSLPSTVQNRNPQAIMDAMDAQGFRGRPKVVTDQAEFDKAVQAAWGGQGLEVVRGIGAPDKRTLADYRDSLTDGDWYVSCNGGAAHGFGQYGAYRFGGKVSARDVQEARMYANSNSGYTGNIHVYHYTLDPSAKIGEESRLRSDMQAHNAAVRSGNTQAVKQATAPILQQLGGGTRAEQAAAKAWNAGRQSASPRRGTTAKYQSEFNAAMTKLRSARDSVPTPRTFRDVGVFAAAKGYDFYYDRRTGYSVTLNRTKLIVLKDW